MRDQNQFQEKLRSLFLELTFNIPNYSYEKTSEILRGELTELLNAKYIGMYTFDYWKETYKIPSNNSDENQFDLEFMKNIKTYSKLIYQTEKDYSIIKEENLFKHYPEEMQTFVIKLNPIDNPHVFLLIILDQDASTVPCLEKLSAHVSQLLKMVNYYQVNEDSKRKNEALFELSSWFHATSNKEEILSETIKALQVFYPSFSYNLLLSQDYEEKDSSLPVEMITYTDGETKSSGKKAFITGEVQIETDQVKKTTCLSAPLIGSQAVYGVLQIKTVKAVSFPEKEIKFITRIANIAGHAIESAILQKHSNSLVSDLRLINTAIQKLNSNVKLPELVAIANEKIMEACKATEVGFVYFLENMSLKFEMLPGSTSYFESRKGHQFIEHLAKEMIEKNQPIFSSDYKRVYRDLPYHSLMSIPMKQSGVMHGFTVIMHEEATHFTFDNFKLMQTLIQHYTLALINTILKEELEKSVITEYMTKLYTRKYLDEMLTMHMQLDAGGALLLFDIDDFKEINDTYGHHIGDEVLMQVAGIIQGNINKDDIPARWGGEEFAIYLPHANMDEGVNIAERIREEVEMLTRPKVTLSCGVSNWIDQGENSVRDIFIRADKALYEAKGLGKNSIMTE